MASFILSREALEDLAAFHGRVSQEDSDLADQGLQATFAILEKLAWSPLMGSVRHFNQTQLGDLHVFRQRGFVDHRIYYYRPRKNGVEILRVLHVALDLDHSIRGDASASPPDIAKSTHRKPGAGCGPGSREQPPRRQQAQ